MSKIGAKKEFILKNKARYSLSFLVSSLFYGGFLSYGQHIPIYLSNLVGNLVEHEYKFLLLSIPAPLF